jgi:hypothetical protein
LGGPPPDSAAPPPVGGPRAPGAPPQRAVGPSLLLGLIVPQQPGQGQCTGDRREMRDYKTCRRVLDLTLCFPLT